MLQSGGQNQKWPTSGPGGYITMPACWVPNASERAAQSEVAHKWARWLHNPCRLGGSPTLRTGEQNQRWPTSGPGGYITLATLGGPHRFTAQNQKWPISGPGGYITLPACGVPRASERGAESEMAHKWAGWQHNPCRLGVPTASERGAESEVAHKWAGWLHNPCRLWGVPTAS